MLLRLLVVGWGGGVGDPPGVQDGEGQHKWASHKDQITAFWEGWEGEAGVHLRLLSMSKIPRDDVGASLIRSNLMLHYAPCPKLRRVARLARLPLSRTLFHEDVYIYVLIGLCLPYIGQTGYVAAIHEYPNNDRREAQNDYEYKLTYTTLEVED